jgi:hypothetical protein
MTQPREGPRSRTRPVGLDGRRSWGEQRCRAATGPSWGHVRRPGCMPLDRLPAKHFDERFSKENLASWVPLLRNAARFRPGLEVLDVGCLATGWSSSTVDRALPSSAVQLRCWSRLSLVKCSGPIVVTRFGSTGRRVIVTAHVGGRWCQVGRSPMADCAWRTLSPAFSRARLAPARSTPRT